MNSEELPQMVSIEDINAPLGFNNKICPNELIKRDFNKNPLYVKHFKYNYETEDRFKYTYKVICIAKDCDNIERKLDNVSWYRVHITNAFKNGLKYINFLVKYDSYLLELYGAVYNYLC